MRWYERVHAQRQFYLMGGHTDTKALTKATQVTIKQNEDEAKKLRAENKARARARAEHALEPNFGRRL